MVALGTIVLYFIETRLPQTSILITIGISAFIPIIISVLAVAYFFFRDPERTSPQVENNILSPADGKIIYIKEIVNGEFPIAVKGKNKIPLSEFTSESFISGKGIQIGIAMSFLHVHVNRSPIKGKIVKIKRVPGFV